jgi:hypothetical protein
VKELIHRLDAWQAHLSWSESTALFIIGALVGYVVSDLIARAIRRHAGREDVTL